MTVLSCILAASMGGQASAISLKEAEDANGAIPALRLCSGMLQGIAGSGLRHDSLVELTPERAVLDQHATLDGDPSQHFVHVWTCRPTPTGIAMDFKGAFRRF